MPQRTIISYKVNNVSLNCVSIVNILSRQNILKTTSKIRFDGKQLQKYDLMTLLQLSSIHYNQKIEQAPMINSTKFH